MGSRCSLLLPLRNRNPLAQQVGQAPSGQDTHLHDFGQDGLVEVVLEGRGAEVPLVHLLILILQERDTPAQPASFQQVPAACRSGGEPPEARITVLLGAAMVLAVLLTYYQRWGMRALSPRPASGSHPCSPSGHFSRARAIAHVELAQF